jgi:hypothetical protein
MLPERGARRGVGRPKTQVLAGPPGVAIPALLGDLRPPHRDWSDGLLVRTREIGLPAVDRLAHLQTHRTGVDLKRLSAKLGPVIRSLQERWLCAGGDGRTRLSWDLRSGCLLGHARSIGAPLSTREKADRSP